jgi:hypothetical protein
MNCICGHGEDEHELECLACEHGHDTEAPEYLEGEECQCVMFEEDEEEPPHD